MVRGVLDYLCVCISRRTRGEPLPTTAEGGAGGGGRYCFAGSPDSWGCDCSPVGESGMRKVYRRDGKGGRGRRGGRFRFV